MIFIYAINVDGNEQDWKKIWKYMKVFLVMLEIFLFLKYYINALTTKNICSMFYNECY
jgi:hypothetical protein